MDLIEIYLAQMVRDRKSSGTIAQKKRMLELLPMSVESLTFEIFEPWWENFQYRADGTLKAAKTVGAELSHLKSFYKWAIRKRYLSLNPCEGVDAPKQGSSRPRPTRETDLSKAMSSAQPMMARMLALGAFAGLRSAEIANLDWNDIDLTSRMLWVRHGKGDKDRSVPVGTALAGYLAPVGTGRVITMANGSTISPKGVSSRINRFLRSQGIESTAHKLRARYATTALEKSGDLILVKDLLGHSSVATTQLYLLASTSKARALADAVGEIG